MNITKKFLISLLVLTTLVGCSARRPIAEPEGADVKSNGLISLTRLAPTVTNTPHSVLGFIPVDSDRVGKWISIDASKGLITLMEGQEAIASAQAEGKMKLEPGRYNILHKQRSPLWYAGDSYFLKRGLSVPGSGDKIRYRRGALGDFALFIDKETSLHSSPVWTDEVGGLRISDEEIRKIYYSVDIGSLIEIK